MRHHDGQRHQFGRFVASITEHQTLVARAAGVHAHGDIGRLRLDHIHDGAGLRIEAHGGIGVANLRDHSADQFGNIHVGRRGDFTGNDTDTGGDQSFAGYAAGGIIRQHGVEDGIGNLVGDFVRVAFRHGF